MGRRRHSLRPPPPEGQRVSPVVRSALAPPSPGPWEGSTAPHAVATPCWNEPLSPKEGKPPARTALTQGLLPGTSARDRVSGPPSRARRRAHLQAEAPVRGPTQGGRHGGARGAGDLGHRVDAASLRDPDGDRRRSTRVEARVTARWRRPLGRRAVRSRVACRDIGSRSRALGRAAGRRLARGGDEVGACRGGRARTDGSPGVGGARHGRGTSTGQRRRRREPTSRGAAREAVADEPSAAGEVGEDGGTALRRPAWLSLQVERPPSGGG